jgi:hypothetical protein
MLSRHDIRNEVPTFNLPAAADILDTTVAALRTMIARRLLEFAGERPLAGDARRFSIIGVYEMGLIFELERAGLSQPAGAELVHEFFGDSIQGAVSAHLREHGIPSTEFGKHLDELLRVHGHEFWLGDLLSSDLSKPVLLLYSFTDTEDQGYHVTTKVVHGWGEIGNAAIQLQRDVLVWERSSPEQVQGFATAGLPTDDDARVQSCLPVVGILNVTLVLSRINEKVEPYLTKVGDMTREEVLA